MPHGEAVRIVFQGRGQHFDPDIVDAFIEIQNEFRDIATRFADSDANLQKKTVLLDGVKKTVWLSARAMRKLPNNIVVVGK